MIGLTAHAALFTLAAIGVSETVYLIEKRKKLERPVCPIGNDCSTVLESKYNRLLFIHNDLTGLMFYIAAATISALLVIGVPYQIKLDLLARVMIIASTAFSLPLLYLQWRVIRAWCFWCVMSAITVFAMFVIILL